MQLQCFMLTNDIHVAYVADKLAIKKPKLSCKTVSKGRPKRQSKQGNTAQAGLS